MESQIPIISSKTFRFKVHTQRLYEEMKCFAQLHCYEDKCTIKENFEKWYESSKIDVLIQKEEEYLEQNQYNLDKTNLRTKIFRSIKYYHIKNILTQNESEETLRYKTKYNPCKQHKKIQENVDESEENGENIDLSLPQKNVKERKKNYTFSKTVLQTVKEHLASVYITPGADHLSNKSEETLSNTIIKPACCYEDYKKQFDEILQRERAMFMEYQDMVDDYDKNKEVEFENKLKKMFKNQYFRLFHSVNQ